MLFQSMSWEKVTKRLHEILNGFLKPSRKKISQNRPSLSFYHLTLIKMLLIKTSGALHNLYPLMN